MNTMLTSGTIGRLNKKYAIETYLRLFTEKVGKECAEQLVSSTIFLPFSKRVWKLEELYKDLVKRGSLEQARRPDWYSSY